MNNNNFFWLQRVY